MPFLKIVFTLLRLCVIPVGLPWLFAYGLFVIPFAPFSPRDDPGRDRLKGPRILWGLELFLRHVKHVFSDFWLSDLDSTKLRNWWRNAGDDRITLIIVNVVFIWGGILLVWGLFAGWYW